MEITIRVEWDMGHRLPHHGGQCRNLHGHRYAAEVTLAGEVGIITGDADEGMVMDFGPVKGIVRHLLEQRDHRFLIAAHDPLADAMHTLPGVVVVDYVPTAENIAADLLAQVRRTVQVQAGVAGVDVTRLRLYETPTSWADAS